MTGPRGRSKCAVLAVVGAVALASLTTLAPSASAAAPALQKYTVAPTNEYSNYPTVVVDSSGRATVLWTSNTNEIRAVRIGADGTQSPAVVLNLSSGGGVDHFSAAVSPSGVVTVVWRIAGPNGSYEQERRLASDGTLLGPINTLSTTDGDTMDPHVVVDSTGKATAIWRYTSGGSPYNYRVQQRQIGADGTLGTIHDLTALGQNDDELGLAVDPQNVVTAVWSTNAQPSLVQEAQTAADGTVGDVKTVSEPSAGNAGGPSIAADPVHGGAVVAYRQFNVTTRFFDIDVRRISGLGGLGTISTISDPGLITNFQPQIGVDAQGGATVAWERVDETNGYLNQTDAVEARRLSASDIATPAQFLEGPTQNGTVGQNTIGLATSSSGPTTVVWDDQSGLQSRRILADGTLEATALVDARARADDRVAVDAAGNPTIVWTGDPGSGTSVTQAAQYLTLPACQDASLTVPAGGMGSVSLPCSGYALTRVSSTPAHGTVAIDQANGTATYTPAAGYSGPDSFTYTASNTGGTSSTASVSITVTPSGPPSHHKLTVSLHGSGSGTVSGSGISCPGACSHSYSDGTVVTLSATAATGSSFKGWSGAGCSGTHACTLTMSADHTDLTATFTKNPPPVAKITEAKINQKKHTATFTFTATGAKATRFHCALTKQAKKHHKQPKPNFSTCHSPKTYKHLKPGHYTFRVKASNTAGTGPAASHGFTIK